MAVVSKSLTLEEFVALPEEEPPLEFADGVMVPKVSPKGKHSRLQLELARRLDEAGRAARVAWAFTELRTTFEGVSRVPNIAVYRWDRIPWDEADEVVNDFRTPPDVTVEIVSPEQGVGGLVRRCLWYVEHGVQVALLVDPDDKSVLAFRPEGRVNALHGGDRIDLGEVLPDFDLTVEQLFASLRRGQPLLPDRAVDPLKQKVRVTGVLRVLSNHAHGDPVKSDRLVVPFVCSLDVEIGERRGGTS